MTLLSQTLYEFYEIMKIIEENEGVIEDSMLPVLIEKENVLVNKVDSYVQFIESIQGQIEQQKKLYKEIQERTRKLEQLEIKLKDNAKKLMNVHNILEIRGNKRKIKLNNSGGKQSIDYPDDFYQNMKVLNKDYIKNLRSEMYTKEEVYTLNSEKVREHLESEKTLECAKLLPRGKYVKLI